MANVTPKLTQIAAGLRFPEGPVAMPDGSVILVEIERRHALARRRPTARSHVVATLGGGPNGAAMGPGREDLHRPTTAASVASSGRAGCSRDPGRRLRGREHPGGRSETARSNALRRLRRAPAARAQRPRVRPGGRLLVHRPRQDARARRRPRRGLLRARPTARRSPRSIFPSSGPNGIGLSPDEQTLYVAETHTARCWAFGLSAPGQIESANGPIAARRAAWWPAWAATRCSTPWPSTARATSAWPR